MPAATISPVAASRGFGNSTIGASSANPIDRTWPLLRLLADGHFEVSGSGLIGDPLYCRSKIPTGVVQRKFAGSTSNNDAERRHTSPGA
jgi:hypothetical protein